MNFMLVQYSVRHDAIDRVVQALEVYVKAVRDNEPGRSVQIYRVPYSNQFYHLVGFKDEEDEKQHRQTTHMQKLLESTRGLLTADFDFVELTQIGSSSI